jgi:hypothetical protein
MHVGPVFKLFDVTMECVVNYNDHKICKIIIVNETETYENINSLLVACIDWKNDDKQNNPMHIESVAR